MVKARFPDVSFKPGSLGPVAQWYGPHFILALFESETLKECGGS